MPKEIIDNSEGNKLVGFLNYVLKENPQTNLDIATAFFDIQAFAMIKDNLDGVARFRLLLGKVPDIQNDRTLGDILLEEIKKEVEGFDLTKESDKTVKLFIEFLKKDNVEIRLYEKFLHGKAYIFDDRMVIGSSNFTAAGLTREGELNTWKQESQAAFTRKEWFEKFWAESRDFKKELITILENSRFGSKEYMPYEIYMKSLYELQKDDIKAENEKEKASELPESKVYLTEFQADAVRRIKTRLKKYGSVLIADSVGLGKTWIAKKILEDVGYYGRKGILVICPAQLRIMWSKELKKIDVKENILSQEELAMSDFIEKAKAAVGGDLSRIELIVVDESHNLRNPLSNRHENFFTLVHDNISKKGRRPQIVFMTATPINNTPWDLYWQIMLMTSMDKGAFIRENIPDLFKFFRDAEKKQDPSMLNDLLNEISIRRTRDYIKKNYPNAFIKIEQPNGETREEKIVFPERTLENINYKLDDSYKGMYRQIADAIAKDLTMAYYNILEYRIKKLSADEKFVSNRMIQIGGIFRTILLKRLESSVDAFRISIKKHIDFLEKLKKHLLKGKLLTKKTLLKYSIGMEEDIDEEIIEKLEDFKIEDYRKDDLFNDIDKDIEILSKILNRVNTIKPEDDAKLAKLKNKLLELSKKGQVVLFTYYADTLEYIHKEISKDKEFSKIKIEAISSSGKTTNKNSQEREDIIKKFFEDKVDIIMSTDVLSEGMNLQKAQFLINYDLHWNPTRMIQRAGRIDRIGSPYKEIFVYNFFPEDELEELLRLVQILQGKIIDIDQSIGLDQSVLGEIIHPKVFGIIRRIKEKDVKIFSEQELEMYGGGEKFYQPLKDFQKNRAIEELESIPNGVHSGLDKNKLKGIFFYYKYGNDFHFWYLYDVAAGELIKNKTQIVNFIACPPSEKRVIPDFFNAVYDANKKVLKDIEDEYKNIEASQKTDSPLGQNIDRSAKFAKKMVTEIQLQIDEYLSEFPTDKELQNNWEHVRAKMLSVPLTKKRLSQLRKIWKEYQNSNNWKKLLKDLNTFLLEKGIHIKEQIEPFDNKKLKLIAIDFVS